MSNFDTTIKVKEIPVQTCHRHLSVVSVLSLLWLGGCSSAPTTSITPQPPPPAVVLQGSVVGGGAPVSGATVQLYAVGSTGYASASTALLGTPATTDAAGTFTITDTYTCPSASSLVYLTATGGNPGVSGAQKNPQLAEMAALGSCESLKPSTKIVVSELTTVAAVVPLAPFMSDMTHIGTSSTNASGMQGAFLSASSLADVSTTGGAGAVPSNVTAPVSELNTLADILSACVSTTGGVASDQTACGKLFTAVTPSGVTAPTDTLGAALLIAQNPGSNVATLFKLAQATSPFQPILASAPNDWTVTMIYSNPAMKTGSQYVNLAIDAGQNVWVDYGKASSNCANCGKLEAVFEYGQDLSLLSPPAGFTDASENGAYSMAFDLSGNLWVTNANASNLTEYSSSGSFIKPVTGGGLSGPNGIAVDNQNNVWVTNSGLGGAYTGVSEFSNVGTAISPTTGYTGGGASYYQNNVALDPSGKAWISAAQGMALLGPNGVAISPSTGYGTDAGTAVAIDGSGKVWTGVGYTHVAAYLPNGQEYSPVGGFSGGGLQGAFGPVVDGAGHIWLSNSDIYMQPKHVGALSEFDANGTALSISTGYATAGLGATSLAIDGAGNVWWPGVGTLYKCIGIAGPVVTPVSVATKSSQLGVRP